MSSRAAITIYKPREEVERLWASSHPEADVRFADAPGERGTEVHLSSEDEPLGKLKDVLRRFKAQVETGEVPRSDGTPEGELAERKLKQRPAQPLDESEAEKAGV